VLFGLQVDSGEDCFKGGVKVSDDLKEFFQGDVVIAVLDPVKVAGGDSAGTRQFWARKMVLFSERLNSLAYLVENLGRGARVVSRGDFLLRARKEAAHDLLTLLASDLSRILGSTRIP